MNFRAKHQFNFADVPTARTKMIYYAYNKNDESIQTPISPVFSRSTNLKQWMKNNNLKFCKDAFCGCAYNDQYYNGHR